MALIDDELFLLGLLTPLQLLKQSFALELTVHHKHAAGELQS